MQRCLWMLWTLLMVALPLKADDWPQFRGPNQGHSTATNLPLTWSEAENITWKTPIPGSGWSSPSILGDQIWVTTATEENHSLRAIGIDRASGRILHDVEVFHLDEPGSIHANNSHASPTPVLEGNRVYVHFGAHGTACLTTAGEIVWKNQTLKYDHRHGPGGSPVIWGNLLIVNCDGSDVQYVIALKKEDGTLRWKRDREHTSEARSTGKAEVPMAYCTPLLIDVAGETQLITLGSDAVVAHDPANGEELWWFSFFGYSNVSMPVYAREKLYFSSGFGKPEFYAARVSGFGDITSGNLVWSTTKQGVVPLDVSPLVVDDVLYTISDAGIAIAYDADDGKVLWQQRLGSKFWASPVVAEGRIYCLGEDGTTTVLAAGRTFEKLAVNKLEGPAQASPAMVDGAIFLRTATHLYRIEKK